MNPHLFLRRTIPWWLITSWPSLGWITVGNVSLKYVNFSSSVTICTHVNYITGQWNFSTLNHIHSLPQLFQEWLLCCYICTSNWGYLEWSISYYMIRSRMLGLCFWSWRLIEVKSSYLWNDSTLTYTINRSGYLSSMYTFMYIPYQRFVRPLPAVWLHCFPQ